jgi:hypothetical protein
MIVVGAVFVFKVQIVLSFFRNVYRRMHMLKFKMKKMKYLETEIPP